MTVRVVTDSSANLPPEWMREFGVVVLPLHLVEEDGRVVGTSAVTPDELEGTYRELLAEPGCTGVVSVHLSQKLSSTVDAARRAAGCDPARIRVVDSRSGGLAVGLPAAQAAWAASAGHELDAVARMAERLASDATTVLAVETLDMLRQGGRIGGAMAVLGGVLSMKPVLEVRDGQIAVAAKTRTMTKALARLREIATEEFERGLTLVAVHAAPGDDRAHELARDLQRRTPHPERVIEVPLDRVLQWHLGAGTVGVTVVDLVDPDFPIPSGHPQAGADRRS